jgi:hypothetical protein
MMSLAPIVLLACAGPAAPPPRPAPAATDPGSIWPIERTQPGPFVYEPQEGDLIFPTRDTLLYTLIYPIARSFHPFHSGVVVRRVTGELALLENGGAGWRVGTLQPLPSRLHHEYEEGKARIWIRKIRAPLTPEQSRALTTFAEGHLGHSFVNFCGLARLALPGRVGPRTYPDQKSWFCSEVVAQALISSGILSPNRVLPQSVTPYELMRDRRGVDLSDKWTGPYVYSPTQGPPPPGPRLARP